VRWHELTAVDAARRIRAGELTSEALVKACLDRIAAREMEVGAWQYLDPERALEAARTADRSEPRGALHGVPIGIKDIIDTCDMPTALGTPLYAQRRPQWDASCVASARAAGAIVLGKTVTTEFAYFTPGKTRNPRDLARTPGGSSSGSAAAVADGMVPLALGSQTAASVIRPAAFCGVFGYRPTFGDMSLSGVRPFAESLDTLGVFARTVDDIVLVRSVLVDRARSFATPSLPQPPRIGLCRTAQWSLADECMRDTVEAVAERCRQRGAAVVDAALPPHFGHLVDAHATIMAFEASRNYVFEMTRHADQLSPQLRELIERGEQTRHASYLEAKDAVAQGMIELGAIMRDHDVLITPASQGEAPLAPATGDPVMSRMWSALHVPCLAVPAGNGPQGLPLAVQLIAASRHDERLLAAGRWIAEALREQ
jgi:amidase